MTVVKHVKVYEAREIIVDVCEQDLERLREENNLSCISDVSDELIIKDVYEFLSAESYMKDEMTTKTWKITEKVCEG